MSVTWKKSAKEKFNQLIAKVPGPMQEFARNKVTKKAEMITADDNRSEITEKDMVDAFFAATPFGFHGPMKSDMESLGINYVQYGHPE